MLSIIEYIRLKTIGKKLHRHLEAQLSPQRFRHVMRVKRVCRVLAHRNGLSVVKAEISALLHDLAREWESEDLLSFVESKGYTPLDAEYKKPILLHGRVASYLGAEIFAIDDEAIHESVIHHTIGTPGLGPLAKVLFVADYIEPGRKYTTRHFRRSVGSMDLDRGLLAVLEHARSRYKYDNERTLAMYRDIKTTVEQLERVGGKST